MRAVRVLLVSLLVCLFAVGCASIEKARENPWPTWSPKKKLTYASNIYATEYDKYVAASIRPDLTPEDKTYLIGKRKALVALDKALQLLIPVVDAGGQVPVNLELQLVDALGLLGYQPM